MAFFKNGQLVELLQTIATAAGTTALTSKSPKDIRFTGTLAQNVLLPDATTLEYLNMSWTIRNRSTGIITVKDGSGAVLDTVATNTAKVFSVSDTTTVAGAWDWSVTPITFEDTPLRIHANAVPDTKIYIEGNSKIGLDGVGLRSTPVAGSIANTVLSTADFTTGATTGQTFSGFTLPTVGTGLYVRCGFTLIIGGIIQVMFSASSSTVAGLADPATLFVGGGLGLGYIDLQSTGTGTFKTAGSATNVIENSVGGVPTIWRFAGGGSGGGSGGGGAVPTGTIIKTSTTTVPLGWLKANGAAVSRTTYFDLFTELVTNQSFTAQTFTVTIASPAVVTHTAHGFTGGERLRLSTTGALPTGLDAVTDYFVAVVDANTFRLQTFAGVIAGTFVNTTGTQSGTHSYTRSLWGLGDGATTFNVPDMRGYFGRYWDDARGIDSNRTFGALQLGAVGPHRHNVSYNGNLGYSGGGGNPNTAWGTVDAANTRETNTTGFNIGSDTRPANYALMALIKY